MGVVKCPYNSASRVQWVEGEFSSPDCSPMRFRSRPPTPADPSTSAMGDAASQPAPRGRSAAPGSPSYASAVTGDNQAQDDFPVLQSSQGQRTSGVTFPDVIDRPALNQPQSQWSTYQGGRPPQLVTPGLRTSFAPGPGWRLPAAPPARPTLGPNLSVYDQQALDQGAFAAWPAREESCDRTAPELHSYQQTYQPASRPAYQPTSLPSYQPQFFYPSAPSPIRFQGPHYVEAANQYPYGVPEFPNSFEHLGAPRLLYQQPNTLRQDLGLRSNTRSITPGTEHLDIRVRNRALCGECIDLTDMLHSIVSVDNNEFKTMVDAAGRLSLRPSKVKKIISSSYKWLEAWAVYETLLCNHFGLQVYNEMVAYRVFIIDLFQQHRLPFVVTYDLKHRQLLGAQRSFQFSELDHKLFVVSFNFNSVRSTARCSRCNSNDHGSNECPFRGAGQGGDLPKGKKFVDKQGERGKSEKTGGTKTDEICFQYQYSRCKAGAKCSRRHECLNCGGPEGSNSCGKCNKQPAAKTS